MLMERKSYKAHLRREKIFWDLKTSSHKNCFVYHSGNTDAHENLKFEVFKWARKQGYLVITEARFKNTDKRPDVLIVDTGTIIEIETDQRPENIAKKKATYNFDWVENIVVLDPRKPFNEKDLL